jgi:hypothetical protein
MKKILFILILLSLTVKVFADDTITFINSRTNENYVLSNILDNSDTILLMVSQGNNGDTFIYSDFSPVVRYVLSNNQNYIKINDGEKIGYNNIWFYNLWYQYTQPQKQFIIIEGK